MESKDQTLTEGKLPTTASTSKKVGAFINFVLALVFSIAFLASSFVTYSILHDEANSFGEALGMIFAVILSVPGVIISSVPMLLFNILSVIFFDRIRKREDKHPVLYKTFFILSVILLVVCLAVGVFDAIILLGN